MILDALTAWWSSWVSAARVQLFAGIDALVPTVPVPVLDACATIAGFVGQLGPIGSLFPWWSLVLALGMWFTGFTAGIAIKLLRITISLFTAGGGSAA